MNRRQKRNEHKDKANAHQRQRRQNKSDEQRDTDNMHRRQKHQNRSDEQRKPTMHVAGKPKAAAKSPSKLRH